jgi:uncharacterized caspase-like protein
MSSALTVAALIAGWFAAAANADDFSDGDGPGRRWAVLVGCEQYARANKLRYTVNDARQLADTLHTWGGFGRDHMLEMNDDSSNPRHKPLRTNIEAELPRYLKKAGPDDVLLVYFSGHGFRDADGKMYLAPLDVDPDNPASTGIPAEWLRREIAACPAAFKLLVIDACHAGSEKGDDDSRGVAARELGETFKDLDQVVTLASSAADEKSQIWEEKQQSLFSYWLNQGLKGHADTDGDGAVDIDELYKYVSRNVTRTAESRFSRPQTPVRIVRSGVHDVPAVVRLQPQRLKSVLADMAEMLADALAERRDQRLGVLEFTNDTRLGELLGADFGPLGKWCASELERQLAGAGGGRFSLVDGRRLQAVLASQRFQLDDLASSARLRKLSAGAGGMPVLALGTLSARSGDIIHLQCKLVRTEGDETLAVAGGTARITESEWAMFGHSAVVEPSLPRSTSRRGVAARQASLRVIQSLDQAAEGPHPLKGNASAFRVRIVVAGKQRPGVVRGNDLYVPLRPGEVFQIEIENRSGQAAAMRLLVDGLNTLPEKAKVKGAAIYEVAPRVNLDEARHWVLDPKKGKVQRVAGFVAVTGVQGEYRDFKVVDADKSLAARRHFTEQVGLITAAFYEPGTSGPELRGALGVDLGEQRSADLTERSDVGIGNLISVINIRYVSPDAMPR